MKNFTNKSCYAKKNFILNYDQDSNPKKISKSIEIIYGLRNFIGNANKFAKEKIFITLKSNNDFSEVIIEDDGEGYPSEILSKIGEPYLRTLDKKKKCKTTLKKNSENKEVFELISRAIKWLNENKYNVNFLKWDTKLWGEIPADFGRK